MHNVLLYSLIQNMYYQLGNCFSPNCIDINACYFGMDNFYPIYGTTILFIITFLGYFVYYRSPAIIYHRQKNLSNLIKTKYENHLFIRLFTLLLYFVIVLIFK